jgi:hypothetical protein
MVVLSGTGGGIQRPFSSVPIFSLAAEQTVPISDRMKKIVKRV